MTSDENPDDVKVERDHPQTRKTEPDARGSSKWREDVVPPEGEREEGAEQATDREIGQEPLGGPVGALAKEAEGVRRQAVGEEKARSAFGSDKDGGE